MRDERRDALARPPTLGRWSFPGEPQPVERRASWDALWPGHLLPEGPEEKGALLPSDA